MVGFALAHLDGMQQLPADNKVLAAGEDFEVGALLIVTANEWVEVGADPAAVSAVSLSGAGALTDPYRRLANKEYPPGECQALPITGVNQRWHAEYLGTDGVLNGPVGAVGTDYGVARGADGIWRVDFSDTTNDVVKLIDLDWNAAPLGRNRVVVSFVAAVITPY